MTTVMEVAQGGCDDDWARKMGLVDYDNSGNEGRPSATRVGDGRPPCSSMVVRRRD